MLRRKKKKSNYIIFTEICECVALGTVSPRAERKCGCSSLGVFECVFWGCEEGVKRIASFTIQC